MSFVDKLTKYKMRKKMHRIFYMRGKYFRTYLNNKYDETIDG